MTEFTATNGITILARENATVDWWSADEVHRGIIQVFTHSQVWGALREFFQHERDEALGRWRWPENPEYVVYRSTFDPSYLYVFNEETADIFGLNGIEGDPNDESVDDDFAVFAAEAFRKAHPERKPWEDAQPGDVWVIEVEGVESFTVNATAEFFGAVSFQTPTGSKVNMTNSTFTGFRKIWPEDAS